MKEHSVYFITMILNFLTALMKFATGVLLGFSTLIADSIQSFVDFLTDIITLIAVKVGKKRANKRYPFGYGQFHYVANLLTGTLLILIGIYIIYEALTQKSNPTIKPVVFLILAIAIIVKIIVVRILRKYGNDYDNDMMIDASKETFSDIISSSIVLVVSIIMYFFGNELNDFIDLDKIGSIIMSMFVLYTAFDLLIHNIDGLVINTTKDSELESKVKSILDKYDESDGKVSKMIKMGDYYHIFIEMKVPNKMIMKDFLKLQDNVKKDINDLKTNIKYVSIEVTGENKK
jgi:cation diffusion facilitator family transporter